jgi:hypothetical protein
VIDQAPAVTLIAPHDWIEFDLDPATRNRSIHELVASRIPAEDNSVLHAQIEARLRTALARASDFGAVMALAFAAVDSEPPNVLAAWLVLTMHPADGLELSGVGDALGYAGARTDAISLPAGPAVRAVAQVRQPVPDSDDEMEVLSVRYVVRLEEHTSLAMLSFGTSNVSLADDFIDLFDAIAESVRVEGGPPNSGADTTASGA